MRSGRELRELAVGEFLAELDALTEIYAAAMNAPASVLSSRRSLMERHASYQAFRAIAARLTAAAGQIRGAARQPGQEAPPEPLTAGAPTAAAGRWPATTGPFTRDPSVRQLSTRNGSAPVIAFAYGFHGAAGQWWHDLVAASLGPGLARDWLRDSFEVAEVHVQPRYQGQGIGRAMMHLLTAGRPERTAVLSTPEGETRARRLYLSLGFADLLPGFYFPGSDQPYTIMGALLPLREAARASAASGSPSR